MKSLHKNWYEIQRRKENRYTHSVTAMVDSSFCIQRQEKCNVKIKSKLKLYRWRKQQQQQKYKQNISTFIFIPFFFVYMLLLFDGGKKEGYKTYTNKTQKSRERNSTRLFFCSRVSIIFNCMPLNRR